MKKNKAFTLVELLAVIVILGLLVALGVTIYSRHIKNAKDNITKIEEQNVINSAISYYNEFKDNYEYIKEIVYKDDKRITYSCVKLKSLIEQGYFKEGTTFNSLSVDDTIIKISSVDGIVDYEIIDKENATDACKYYKLNKDFDSVNTTNNQSQIDENSLLTFDSSITNIDRREDKYELNLNLTLDFTAITTDYPVYVLIVMDKSGSMADSYEKGKKKFTRSRDAAIELSQNVVAINDQAYIGMVEFGDKVDKVVDFRREPLTTGDFVKTGGGTNIIAGLDKAIDMVSNIPSQSIKYVIFLSDGYPQLSSGNKYGKEPLPYPKAHYSVCSGKKVTAACKSTLIGYRDQLGAMNATLVIVGYEMKIDDYKEVASVDQSGNACPNATVYNGENHCYYESTSGNLSQLFSELSTAILEIVTDIKSGVIKGKFSNAITVYNEEGNIIYDFELPVEIDENQIVETSFTKAFKYRFKINDINIENVTEGYQYSVPLVDDFTMDLYNSNDMLLKTISLNSPILNINVSEDSYLN